MNRNTIVWIVSLVLIFALFNLFQNSQSGNSGSEVAFSEFVTEVEQGRVKEVEIQGREIAFTDLTGKKFETYSPNDPDLVERLLEGKVSKITAIPPDSGISLSSIFFSLLPILLLIGFWFFMMRNMQGGGGGARGMGFGKSKAKLLTPNMDRKTFEDVAGVDEAKADVEEVVEFLREPAKFQRLGGKIPKGVLLVGPPGTGKTFFAKAVAGEANIPFFSISGSDFVEMFVGVGASRVRDMFEQAKKNAPCIIFIDEIDAVGRARSQGASGGHEEREQTLNQLLVEMDGFESNEGIIIVAATNRADVLDKALLRPGRFDRQVTVPLPDITGREKILNVHVNAVPLGPDVDLHRIARGTTGFSGADLANLVNEAALHAARTNKRVVTSGDFEEARDKVKMGSARRSLVMKTEEIERTAYHEAGHALVSMYVPVKAPLHKLTIIPRGPALGFAEYLPIDDGVSFTEAQMKADLAMTFGGRVAEELIYGAENITSGASSDIRQASRLARKMVEEWGFSESLGRLFYGPQESYFGNQKDVSPETQGTIDKEVRSLISEGEDKAREILVKHNDELENLARGMIEYETVTAEEARILMKGGKLDRSDKDGKPPRSPRSKLPKSGLPQSTSESEDKTLKDTPPKETPAEPA
ncbi:MAG: ATP-dependent zinc metalloprotease FtsH [Alphaproteobacteria bacterium]